MNVASKELCQELYKLSGWDKEIDDVMRWYGRRRDGIFELDYAPAYTTTLDEQPSFIPAYDAGFLLRKLPKTVKHPVTGDDHTIGVSWHIDKKKWVADYERSMIAHAYADTPEDALAKLAIELLKQGVLTREN